MKGLFRKAGRLISAVTAVIMSVSALSASTVSASAALSNGNDAFMRCMGAGWNLGNTLDATGGSGLDSETSWVHTKTTEKMIKFVHSSGFNTIRIPVSWANHMDQDYTIDSAWLKRVKEVVDYAYNDGMYVILNTHHDNLTSPSDYGIGYYPDKAHQEISMRYVTAVWNQVAIAFRNYGDRLIFETLNEPRLRGTGSEWWVDPNNPDAAGKEAFEMINMYNSQAAQIIRSSGGKNTTRYIMVPSYAASYEAALSPYFKLPKDTVSSNRNRIAVSVHAYKPNELCLNGGKTDFNDSDKAELSKIFSALDQKFLANGVPVVIGEMGISFKNNDKVRREWLKYYYGLSKKYGIPCCLWDNGADNNSGNEGERHGHLDRVNLKWNNSANIKAIMDIMRDFKYGDVNGDGEIDSDDIVLLQQYICNWRVDIDVRAANVDDDPAINNDDIIRIQQYSCKWRVQLGH